MYKDDSLSCCYCFLNVIWILTGGLFLCIMEGFIGVIYCITICGIPFGLQHFKLARLALMPFGAVVVEKDALANAGGVIVQPPPVVVVQQGYTPPVQAAACGPHAADEAGPGALPHWRRHELPSLHPPRH